MTFDAETHARQLFKELHEKGYEDARVSIMASADKDALKWFVGIGGKSVIKSNPSFGYGEFTGDCPLEAYEAAEKAIAALPDKDAEARAKLTEEAKELAKRMEALGMTMTWEDVTNG